MKIRVLGSLLAGVIAVTAQVTYAQVAPPNVTITADENGRGTLGFAGSVASPLPGVVTPDGLFYDMQGPPALVGGDLLLLDTDGSTSDVIRFGFYNNAYGFYFHSGDNTGDLADAGGLPSVLLPNIWSIAEGSPYIPTPNEPGYVGQGFTVEYLLNSPEGNVPDGGMAAGLLALALGSLGGLRRFMR
jgi:hypothetical protein